MNQAQKVETVFSKEQPSVTRNDRKKALIVDDNPIDRRRIKAMCDEAELDFIFVEASSIAEMQMELRAQTFSLIFIDFRLEDGDGLGALNLIKRDPKNGSAATIMVAGVAQASIAVAALKSGCSDYILKDALDPHWLRRAVASALEKSQLVRAFDASEQMRATLQTTLRGFSRECVVEMRPLLSRMLRQVRKLRALTDDANASKGNEEIEELILSCERLWEFVESIENVALETCEKQLLAT